MALNQESIELPGFYGYSTVECSEIEENDFVCSDDSPASKSEKVYEDIIDFLPKDPFSMHCSTGLPSDPFHMGIESPVSSITCWIEELGLKACDIEIKGEGKVVDEANLLGELNLVWTSSVKFELEGQKDEMVNGNEANMETHSVDKMLFCDQYSMCGNWEEFSCYGCEKYQKEQVIDSHVDVDGDAPADALSYALYYLGIRDLLSVEMVCKSLRDTVQNDPLLWRNIYVDHQLSYKIMDENLLRLTNRAQGSLRCLSLVNCKEITQDALMLVLESNPHLTKLSVPGCIKFKIDRILHDIRVFNAFASPGIKHLRISENFRLTDQHLLEFKLLLGAENEKKSSTYRPRFYCEELGNLSLDDERALDIEICPRCKQVRQVYDCPVKGCRAKLDPSQACRACITCIVRCIGCGCCLDDRDYEETLYLDLICFDCLARLLDSPDVPNFISTTAYFHQRTECHFVFCG